MTLSRRQRIAITAAPLCSAVGLALRQTHLLGSGDGADAILGAVIGIGIGISLTALIRRPKCETRAG
jgi:hypothetical protein